MRRSGPSKHAASGDARAITQSVPWRCGSVARPRPGGTPALEIAGPQPVPAAHARSPRSAQTRIQPTSSPAVSDKQSQPRRVGRRVGVGAKFLRQQAPSAARRWQGSGYGGCRRCSASNRSALPVIAGRRLVEVKPLSASVGNSDRAGGAHPVVLVQETMSPPSAVRKLRPFTRLAREAAAGHGSRRTTERCSPRRRAARRFDQRICPVRSVERGDVPIFNAHLRGIGDHRARGQNAESRRMSYWIADTVAAAMHDLSR
jgi:hypothetical protein